MEVAMYTKRIIEFEIIWYFSWRPLLYTLGLAVAVYVSLLALAQNDVAFLADSNRGHRRRVLCRLQKQLIV